jgi:hypothetical protein
MTGSLPRCRWPSEGIHLGRYHLMYWCCALLAKLAALREQRSDLGTALEAPQPVVALGAGT